MTKLKSGDTVKVHYTGMLEDGRVFGSSQGREPLEFKVGGGQIIRGVESGVLGMEVGETRKFEVTPDKGYGPRHEELVVAVPVAEFPDNITPEIGLKLQLKQEQGRPMEAVITDLSEDTVTLDANHPLAGQTLHFQVELLEITNPA